MTPLLDFILALQYLSVTDIPVSAICIQYCWYALVYYIACTLKMSFQAQLTRKLYLALGYSMEPILFILPSLKLLICFVNYANAFLLFQYGVQQNAV